ncbi:hypothetical protein ACJX0J_015728 [Zea mays]
MLLFKKNILSIDVYIVPMVKTQDGTDATNPLTLLTLGKNYYYGDTYTADREPESQIVRLDTLTCHHVLYRSTLLICLELESWYLMFDFGYLQAIFQQHVLIMPVDAWKQQEHMASSSWLFPHVFHLKYLFHFLEKTTLMMIY